MILRLLAGSLVLMAVTLIQTTWVSAVAILGAKPDLPLIVLVWLAYRDGPVLGSSLGFISGLMDDVLSSAPLGFGAFVKTAVAWISSLLHGAMHLDHFLMPLLLGATMTVAKALASLLLTILFRGNLESYDFLSRIFWIEVGYNALVAPAVFFALELAFKALGRAGKPVE